MRCHGDRCRVLSPGQPRADIPRPIQLGFPPQASEPLREPCGARVFEEGRSWNAAQPQMLVINPGALLAEPFEAGLDPRRRGEIRDCLRAEKHGTFSLACSA